MSSKLLVLIPVIASLSACAGIGSTGNDTSFERTGVQSCTTASVTAVGTATDPVRCGPQAQPIVR
ncbi:hypothetical protein [Yoonia sp. 208BN28-4]|uniref:hypothetical protein n=1 Tax=Yoonia sp. 208BN28-4 TaxID=3126505 RepID=UPI0030AA490C